MKEYRLKRRRLNLKFIIPITLCIMTLSLVHSFYVPKTSEPEEEITINVIYPKSRYMIDTMANDEIYDDILEASEPEQIYFPPQLEEDEIPDWDANSNSILNVTNATEEQYNMMAEYIVEHRSIENSDMLNIGAALVEVEEQYGISGVAILSITTWESGFGESCITTNNLGGIKINGEYTSFNSNNECILYMGKLLDTYVSNGLISWEEIGSKYCDDEWAIKIPNTIDHYNEIMYKIITDESIS